ncbi:MAG: hypothetical protein WA842_13785 [Croceibacterium sp.]
MRRLLFQTTVIQSLGTILMLLLTLIISRYGGPSTQGSFALVKSFNDLQVAVFSLGLPPAIVIMLNRTGRGHLAIERLLVRYSLVLILGLPFVNAAVLHWLGDVGSGSRLATQAALIGLASAIFTLTAFMRALLLVHTDGPIFSFISIFHWVIIFLLSLILMNRTELTFEFAYFFAAISTAALTISVLRRYQKSAQIRTNGEHIEWTLLRAQAGHVLLQAVLYGLQPFASNALLARTDPDLTSTGLFNVASLIITLPNFLVALVAPVLLNRWSKALEPGGLARAAFFAAGFGVCGQAAALFCIPLLPMLIEQLLGTMFLPAAYPTEILLLSVFAVICGRILTPALQGLGRNDLVSLSCIARVVTITAGYWVSAFWFEQSAVFALAIGWCMGEYSAVCILLAATRIICRANCSPIAG